MPDKRPAGPSRASAGRQYKQTKLNFGSPSATPPTNPEPTPSESKDNSTKLDEAIRDEASNPAGKHNKTITDKTPAQKPSSTMRMRIRITDRTGDLFSAPPGAVLIHACNALGSWGGGIALAFRNHYPDAFHAYRAHCARSTPDQLVGTALLIPPPPSEALKDSGRGRGHYIGCLFTSRGYGAARDSPQQILRATVPAMRDLMRQIVREERERGARIAEVRMCRINSGLFAVPWEESKKAIEEMELGKGEVPACAEDGVLEVVAWERE